MKKNPLKELEALGQSVWLDFISRELIKTGKLKQLIENDGLRGMTSNPNIFEKSITAGKDYQSDIQQLAKAGSTVEEVYGALTQSDIKQAADEFHSVFVNTQGDDGFVSLEVNPHFAHDTEKSIAEARALWQALNRPNVFIKIPATKEGLPAITQLISEGININVTLLFGLDRYREVAEAYLQGIEKRLDEKKPVHAISSVASFFLSRIDVLIDPLLEKIMSEQSEKSLIAKRLHGQIAIASAKIAYQINAEIFASDRFEKLTKQGARIQRLLWASTGTKNPAYSDVKYVDEIIAINTVNTMPLETIDAYRDHGDPDVRIETAVDEAVWVFEQLPGLGIHIDKLTQQLEDEGVEKFNQAYDQLITALKKLLKE